MDSDFLKERTSTYAEAIYRTDGDLDNCVGFIDGTVIAIAPPGKNKEQNVVYSGHKRKHALKFHVVTTPDGLILHACGSIESHRHDWALYIRLGLEEKLGDLLLVDGMQYCIYGDSRYNQRSFMEIPFQESNLSGAQKSYNQAISKCRVTVEWILKEIKLYWTTVDFKREMRVAESPIGAIYISAILLADLHKFVYPNTISQYFKCKPPLLEEYLVNKNQSD